VVEISRRNALKGGLGMVAGAALGGAAQTVLAGAAGASTTVRGRRALDPLELRPIPDQRDGTVRLWLPEGFEYRSFHDTETGALLGDGTRVPGRHDGMGAFPGGPGHVALVRNHEINGPGTPISTTAPLYDAKGRSGTTSILVDGQGNVVASIASLAGTQMNCAGGAMPWYSWITCEETVNGPDVFDDFTRGSLPATTYVQNSQLTKPHGYIFEVPLATAATAQPIRSAGRFAHEAVACDPHTGILYLTEDDFGFPSGFYKYVPPVHPSQNGWSIADGGALYMLAVWGEPNRDMTAKNGPTEFSTTWVRIDDPDPTFPMAGGLPTTINDDAICAVARQGWAKGAAYFSRLEGAVFNAADRRIYFNSTQGGGDPESPDVSTPRSVSGYGKGTGQVWAYDTVTTKLHLVFESPGPHVLDFPDNLTVSPNGRVVVCEDNINDNFVRAITPSGGLFDLALNRLVGVSGASRFNDEFAGACFSPDGQTMFVNIQATNGMTFAIWGPWAAVGLA
jgi:uncharacterized protein